MSNYCYEAIDSGGLKIRGMVDVTDQSEALRRIKEMGLFPTRVAQARRRLTPAHQKSLPVRRRWALVAPVSIGRIRPRALAVFTRQLATLVEAGMPLLRGLRTLQEQEENPRLKAVVIELAEAIEGGLSLSEAMAAHPRVFNGLYCNMVKAGELGGALEVTLRRLAEFLEKAQRIKGKVKSALFYPTTVLLVALVILGALMVYVVPRFQQVFQGLLNGAAMPPFTLFILRASEAIQNHLLFAGLAVAILVAVFTVGIRTKWGRWTLDRCKLSVPVLGPVFRKASISRFARTLGTLLHSGVPVLQSLTIVRETTGNVVVSSVVARVHDRVKEGDSIAVPLRASGIFPAMVAGMVDVGEQTGALPDMLLKVADTYDEEVDNAVSAMTSILEPIMIIFLAVVVGSIVIALYLPILYVVNNGAEGGARAGAEF